jgi:hypothetical protein
MRINMPLIRLISIAGKPHMIYEIGVLISYFWEALQWRVGEIQQGMCACG